jgi:hypothetical protein
MERARHGGRAGRDAGADDAHGQTHQCRVPDLGLNAGRQYHDGRAWRGTDAFGAARAGIVNNGERADAVTASDTGGGPGAVGGQEAGCAKIRAPSLRAGSACARSASW